jgi:hypothetical protein
MKLVTRQEFEILLKPFGIESGKRTILRYEQEKRISPASRNNIDNTPGRSTRYSIIAVWEFAAGWSLIHGKWFFEDIFFVEPPKFDPQDVSIIRLLSQAYQTTNGDIFQEQAIELLADRLKISSDMAEHVLNATLYKNYFRFGIDAWLSNYAYFREKISIV